jgi:hypothetical protein
MHALYLQLRHLRYMLAIAKQLNRTLLLTGIKKHYLDRGRQLSNYTMLRLQTEHARSKAATTAAGAHSFISSNSRPAAQQLQGLPRPCFAETAAPDWIEFEELLDR